MQDQPQFRMHENIHFSVAPNFINVTLGKRAGIVTQGTIFMLAGEAARLPDSLPRRQMSIRGLIRNWVLNSLVPLFNNFKDLSYLDSGCKIICINQSSR